MKADWCRGREWSVSLPKEMTDPTYDPRGFTVVMDDKLAPERRKVLFAQSILLKADDVSVTWTYPVPEPPKP